jgi:predicted DNA-binding helix-hairpin-helix protein
VRKLAPQKDPASIRKTMAGVRLKKEEYAEPSFRGRRKASFAPAGQSTQLIVGADAASDGAILANSARLYGSYALKRVYYSAFSPIPDSSSALPLIKPPLMREHRLYQADWLMRFYGFSAQELADPAEGMLDLALDPKLAWALGNRAAFPVDVNRAEREALLRVPGFGTKSVGRILGARRHKRLRYDDLARIGAQMKKAQPFVTAADWSPGAATDSAGLRARFAPPPEQLSLF